MDEPLKTPLVFKTIAIIGLGLIGGSLAKLIRHQLPDTKIFALDKEKILQQALSEKIIDTALTGLEDSKLASADLIILGTHLDQSETILKTLVEQAKKPIHVMDLGSVKGSICAIADSLTNNLVFIGGHPMAGREISGYENSKWDLFLAKRFLLTPCQKTTTELEGNIALWLRELGMIPVSLDAQRHDQLMALVSHFPQFYAIALANLLESNQPQEALQFLGGGIDDQMRLMASPYEMWENVFLKNSEALNDMLDQFIELFTNMKDALNNGKLKTWFDKSHEVYRLYQANTKR